MSSGPFRLVRYEATYSNAAVHPIRIQPETLLLTIETPSGSVDNEVPQDSEINNPISARVSGGRRALGLAARKVVIQFNEVPPAGYQFGGRIALPWLSRTTFQDLARAQDATYLNASCTVVGLIPENVN